MRPRACNGRWSIGTWSAPNGTTSPRAPAPNGSGSRASAGARLVTHPLAFADAQCVADGATVHACSVVTFNQQRDAPVLLHVTRPRQSVVECSEFLEQSFLYCLSEMHRVA